jgi:hypothetical protein
MVASAVLVAQATVVAPAVPAVSVALEERAVAFRTLRASKAVPAELAAHHLREPMAERQATAAQAAAAELVAP